MVRLTRRVLRGATIVVALVCAYAAGVAAGGSRSYHPQPPERATLDETAEKIANDAAAPVPRRDLERAAIDAMLRRLGDRWARYYTAEEYDDVQGRLVGKYSGVGLWLGTADGRHSVQVASVQPESPADRAGVHAGDVITDVGGHSAAGRSVAQVAADLRGAPSTGVAVAVRRDGKEHRFRLVRSAIAARDVSVDQQDDEVQLIRVAAFTRGVGRQVRDVVTEQAERHRGGIILDLRGNPGGLFHEAVETASAFLRGGPVVTYERRGEPPQQIAAAGSGDVTTPLVVLVDAGTASAAEVVAGSLRDRDRAVIIGSRTFGKGSVQAPVRLPDGSAIELTIGRYRTPNGRSLDGTGIDPDVAVNSDSSPREAEWRAQTVLRGLLATLPTKDRG